MALKPTGNWWQVEPRLHLMTARTGSTNLATLTGRWLNGWMNVKIAPPSGWTPDLLCWIVKRYFKLEGILDVLRLSNNRATCLLSLLPSSPTCTWCLGRGTAACSANVCAFGCFTRWSIIVADDRLATETSALEPIDISKTWLWRKNQQSCSCDDWTGTEPLLKLFTIHFFPLSLSSYLSSILHIWIIPVWTDVTGRFQLNLIWCPCTQQQLGDTN